MSTYGDGGKEFDDGYFYDEGTLFDERDSIDNVYVVHPTLTPASNPIIRRGKVVPPGAVNLAWTKSPQITPQNNLIIIDTSNIADGNVDTSVSGFYYADDMGVLQDITGNQLFQDSNPAVTDQLSVEGNLTGVDLTGQYIYPFKHVSRYFHIDYVGLTHGSQLTDYSSSAIRVVDSQGRNYVDGDGNPRYKIQLTPALSGSSDIYDTILEALNPSPWWRMDNLSVVNGVTDYANNAYPGTPQGGYILNQVGPNVGLSSIRFDGQSGYVTTGWIPQGSALSVTGWYQGSTVSGSPQIVIDNGAAINGQGFGVWITVNGALEGAVNSGIVTDSVNSLDGKFHSFALTYDGTTVSLYKDGSLVGQSAASGAVSSGNSATIAAARGGVDFFSGNLSDIAAFDYSLTAAQISELAEAGAYEFPSISSGNTPAQNSLIGNESAYRVYAFVDDDTNENLYLTYDKIEISNDGFLTNQVVGYKELLNPQPAFEFRPEVAEVVDLTNRDKEWYSSQDVGYSREALGLPSTANGYKIFVPKKALNDPRIFQTFRWRVTCNFSETVTSEADQGYINVGVVISNANPVSSCAKVWLTLQENDINLKDVTFRNPLSENVAGAATQTSDEYWYVNFDSITNSQLQQFDALVWAPPPGTFDFEPYWPKIRYFTQTLGRILLIDTQNHCVPLNLGLSVTDAFSPSDPTKMVTTTGTFTGGGADNNPYAYAATAYVVDVDSADSGTDLATAIQNSSFSTGTGFSTGDQWPYSTRALNNGTSFPTGLYHTTTGSASNNPNPVTTTTTTVTSSGPAPGNYLQGEGGTWLDESGGTPGLVYPQGGGPPVAGNFSPVAAGTTNAVTGTFYSSTAQPTTVTASSGTTSSGSGPGVQGTYGYWISGDPGSTWGMLYPDAVNGYTGQPIPGMWLSVDSSIPDAVAGWFYPTGATTSDTTATTTTTTVVATTTTNTYPSLVGQHGSWVNGDGPQGLVYFDGGGNPLAGGWVEASAGATGATLGTFYASNLQPTYSPSGAQGTTTVPGYHGYYIDGGDPGSIAGILYPDAVNGYTGAPLAGDWLQVDSSTAGAVVGYFYPTGASNNTTYINYPTSTTVTPPTVFSGPSVWDASSLGGWTIDDNTPVSLYQTDWGMGGGAVQFISTLPTNAENLAMATQVSSRSFSVTASNIASQAIWNSTIYTSQMGAVYGNTATNYSADGHTVTANVPSLGSGQIYDRTEVFQDIVFSGATGDVVDTVLQGGSASNGFNAITRTGTITDTSVEIVGSDYCVDTTTLGSTVTLSMGNIELQTSATPSIPSVALKATVFYHQDTQNTTTYTVPSGGTTLSNFPVYVAVPVVAQIDNLYISTCDVPQSALSGMTGARQFLYNLLMLATSNGNIYQSAGSSSFNSSYSISSPWTLSWTINTTTNPGVLSDVEKSKYDFIYLPQDPSNPVLTWQRQLSNRTLREIIDDSLTYEALAMIGDATRSYEIEVTNSNVSVPITLTDDSYPYAWTYAYTPQYTVPADYTSYIIQEKEVPAQYEPGQYIQKSYPSKPYSLKVLSSYDTASTLPVAINETAWYAYGTATLTWDTTVWNPPVTTLQPVTVNSSQPVAPSQQTITIPNTSTVTQEVTLNWKDYGPQDASGSPTFYTANVPPFYGAKIPYGLFTWQQANYMSNASANLGTPRIPIYASSLNWVYNGLTGQYDPGASGDVVKFLQDALNRITQAGLAVDGIYGNATKNAVYNFQVKMGARYTDGETDAETWSFIGGQIIANGLNGSNTGNSFYDYPYIHMQMEAISDGNPNNHYAKRSWATGGPSYIWEIFSFYTVKDYQIHEIGLVPYLEGSTKTLIWQAADVRHIGSDPDGALVNLDPNTLTLPGKGAISNGGSYAVDFSPISGNFIMVLVGQNGPGYSPSNRMLGIADLTAKATVTKTVTTYTTSTVANNSDGISNVTLTYVDLQPVTTPGYYSTTVNSATVNISASGIVSGISPTQPSYVQAVPTVPSPPASSGGGTTSGGGDGPTLQGQSGTWLETTSASAPQGLVYPQGGGPPVAGGFTSVSPGTPESITGTFYSSTDQPTSGASGGGTSVTGIYGSWISGDPGSVWGILYPDAVNGYTGQPLAGEWLQVSADTAGAVAGWFYPTGAANTSNNAVTNNASLSNIVWSGVAVSNSEATATITSGGLVAISSNQYTTALGTGVVDGPQIPNQGEVWYSKDINGNVRLYPETGWASREEGIKLLCNADGSPFGFPSFAAGTTSTQRDFTRLNIVTSGTDPSIVVGFYDISQKEFVVNILGKPEIAYADYVQRGPQNIFIGVLATLEIDTPMTLPSYQPGQYNGNSDDAPMLPFMLTLPIYGVKTTPYSKISIAPLPSSLGPDDIWPVAIRTGRFSQYVTIPVGVTTSMYPYAGTKVTAYYSVPEADTAPWSSLFGRPNVDVLGEHPIIADDYVIQVRQTPILMKQFPTNNPGPADPVIPIFTVYQRDSLTAPWVQLSASQIADYNASTGEIFLQNIDFVGDPNLFKVDYTSAQQYYYFKQYGGQPLNLNPYPDQEKQYVDESLYIYILPQSVRDFRGVLIPEATQAKTLRFTTDPAIFDPQSSVYDPLALQLGIVRVTSNVNVDDLVILDSRQRGGGAPYGMAAEQVMAMLDEARNYWDIGYSGSSYQNSGFVIIRLPSVLKDRYTDGFIAQAIRDNLAAGVEFRLEDTEGNPW